MQVKLSKGNMKIPCLNVSLTPLASCAPGVPCAKRCYALKAYRQYPGVRAAWDHNHALAQANPIGFTSEISQVCRQKRPAFFRWHVAGDIPSNLYLAGMLACAFENPATTFLCFTKRADLVNDYLTTCENHKFRGLINHPIIPPNLRLVLSAWPGAPLDNPHGLPVAWLTTDARRPREGFDCPGSCKSCKHCWIDKKGVAFDPH